MTRPTFVPPAGLPDAVAKRVAAKAAASYCYVSPEGAAFYVDADKAQRLLAENGGQVFPPLTDV